LEFVHPGLLWLVLFIPALLYVRLRRRRSAVPMPGLSGRMALPKARFANLPLILFAIAAALLILASARPRMPLASSEKKLMGVDVALALDVSGSMKAEDFKPNRMEAAKARIKEFVRDFKQGRMALVAFAGRSFTQCPLTLDGGILEGLVDQLDVGSVTIDGTAIGDAVINCMAKFREGGSSKVIVLLTDGENNAGSVDPVSAARAAAAEGIKIYSIGVGTPGGAPVPVYSPTGQKFYLTGPDGRPVMAKVDEAGLKQIADITGGTYFRAEDEHALGEVYRKIAEMEKHEITVKRVTGYYELSVYPAGLALILLALGAWLMRGRLRVLG
jgi:Ca-activated chloride channel family protein